MGRGCTAGCWRSLTWIPQVSGMPPGHLGPRVKRFGEVPNGKRPERRGLLLFSDRVLVFWQVGAKVCHSLQIDLSIYLFIVVFFPCLGAIDGMCPVIANFFFFVKVDSYSSFQLNLILG